MIHHKARDFRRACSELAQAVKLDPLNTQVRRPAHFCFRMIGCPSSRFGPLWPTSRLTSKILERKRRFWTVSDHSDSFQTVVSPKFGDARLFQAGPTDRILKSVVLKDFRRRKNNFALAQTLL